MTETASSSALELYTLLLVIFTGVLAVSTIGLWFVTWRATRVARRAASAAEEANRLSRDMYVTGNRPWIRAAVSLSGQLTHTDEDGWHVTVAYALRNVGNSPAIDVFAQVSIIPLVIDAWTEEMLKGRSVLEMPRLGTDIATEAKRLRDAGEAVANGFGITVFPGEEHLGRCGVHAKALFERARELETYSGQFQLIFCASYRFVFDERRRVTTKAFNLFKPPDETGKYPNIDLNGEDIAAERLVLAPYPLQQTDFAT